MAAVNVNEIIRRAYEEIAVISSSEDLTGEQQARGLYLLNEEIACLNGSGISVNYYSSVDFNLIPEKMEYTIGPSGTGSDVTAQRFVEVEFVRITFSNTIYNIPIVTRFEAYIVGKILPPNTSIPGQVWVTYDNTQTKLHFYLPPNLPYSCQILGKQEMQEFTLFSVITNVPTHVFKYFRLKLASQLARQYPSQTWTSAHQMDLDNVTKLLYVQNEIDVAIRPGPALTKSNSASGNYLTPIYGGI